MRFRVWDRMLAALSGLLIFLLGAALLVLGAGLMPETYLAVLQGPFETWQCAVIIAVAVVLCLLGIHGLWMLFRRRTDKGFIIQRTDMGDMSISMSALGNMVRKCVDQHQEITIRKTRIHRVRDGVVVDLKVLLASGVNIPLTVNVLQKQVKQYITSCSGIDVHEVRVMVETDAEPVAVEKPEETSPVPSEKPAQSVQMIPEEEPVVEHAAECILRHTEEPADYVEAPVCVQPVVETEEVVEELPEELPSAFEETVVEEEQPEAIENPAAEIEVAEEENPVEVIEAEQPDETENVFVEGSAE